MSVSTPRMSGNRKERKAQKSRIWKFPPGLSVKKPLENTTEDEELARSFPKTTVADFLYNDSEEDANSTATTTTTTTVEKSGKSFPGSHLSPSQRGNSFSAARRKQAQFTYDGYPPSGYLWIWMGVLRRWHRNHFLLETPGVLTHSRRRGSQMRGAFCLRDARVVSSQGHSRQFCIISPAGVAYLRAMCRDQRGPWINSIRESIEKYTQCVEQAERIRASVGTTFMAVEPEEARLENEERDRVHERMSELLPHQAVLKWQMNQLTRKMDTVNGGEASLDGDGCSGRRSSIEKNAMRRLSSQPASGLEALDENRMIRHASLTSELSLRPEKSNLPGRRPRRSAPIQSKVSADDSTVRTKSSVHIKEMRDRATARKCQTPRPEGAIRRRLARRSPHSRRSPRDVDENGKRECATPRLSIDATPPPPPPRTRDLASLNESGMWKSYQNFIDAVQRIIQKEVRSTMELEIENAALRQLLEMKRSETPVAHNHSLHATSGSTSRSYSTAESELDATLLEHSEDETLEKKEIHKRDIKTSHEDSNNSHKNRELMDALEVVRRAEYVTRNSSNSEGLVVSLQSVVPPKDSEDDDESNLDQEVYPPSLYSSAEFFVKEGDDLYALEPRNRLPAPRPIQRGFSLWSILKNAIGRDLSRITMPATINEPLSALQRLVEEFEHASILTSAALSSDPHERLLYVTAFVLSSYHGALLRDSKPFNPLLGETFEWSNNQIRFLGEQVSHHPPVSCFHVQGFDAEHENQLYHMQGELELKSKFWGTTLNVFPAGRIELFLETTQERYVWNKASISIHNLVLGQLWLDFHGDIQIKNVTTGDMAKIRLTKARGFGMDRGNLEGKIYNVQKEEVYAVDGNFTKSIYARPSAQSHRYEIFRAAELPPDAGEQYNMTSFAVALNDIRGAGPGELPRTDSRFRTDIRALEVGDFSGATREKLRLEEKQRQTRKVRKENGQKYIPMWFNLRRPDIKDLSKIIDHDQASVWKFRDEYWKRKEKRNWGGCPDIF